VLRAVFYNLDEESNIKYPLKLCGKYVYHLLLLFSYSKKHRVYTVTKLTDCFLYNANCVAKQHELDFYVQYN
jgi:hypothetical protein